MMVVVVVSTESGPPPTLDSPLSLFRRFVLPLFTSHPRARHIPLFSFVSLFFSPRVLCISSAFSLFVLSARSPFLPTSPFHRSVLMLFSRLPPSFLPPLYNHFIFFLVFLHLVISARANQTGCVASFRRRLSLVELLSGYRAFEFLGQSATRMRTCPFTHRRRRNGISKVKTARCKIHFHLSYFFTLSLLSSVLLSPRPSISHPVTDRFDRGTRANCNYLAASKPMRSRV